MDRYFVIAESQHFFLSLIIALFLFWRHRDWRLISACLLFGFLIDADHLVDYFAFYGLNFNLNRFFNVLSYMEPSGKIYIPLHGWEFVILFWFIGKRIGKKFKIKGLEWALSLPYLGHLFLDNFSFSHHPLAYSFIFRLLNNFSLKSFNGF